MQRDVYALGDEAFQPSGIHGKVELTADVHYPRGLRTGPYPLVLFLHGNHSACYRGDREGYMWPCRKGYKPLPNYTGYDYIAQAVSHGLTHAAAATGVPMAFGVLTTNSAEEALARVPNGPGNKGWEAAMAGVEMATLLARLGDGRPGGPP